MAHSLKKRIRSLGQLRATTRVRCMGWFVPTVFAICAVAGAEPDASPFAVREFYAPGHFGNSYESMGEREMRAILTEAAWWGFNSYGDWFDVIDCSDPFVRSSHEMARALWERKKAHFRSARDLGLDCSLLISPNHVYLDQVASHLRAAAGDRIMGQVICPSLPEARVIILKNHENMFADLARAGVRLRGLVAGAYDYGGCGCDRCRPWIVTFAALCKEIHAIAARHHPGIEMRFLGWWWKKEEHRLFADWADREAPGWAKAVALSIPYGGTDVADVPLPRGCEPWAFVHMGYGEQESPRDVYGHLGPVMAADRLEKTVADLRRRGVRGIMAYSEGNYEDVNRAVVGGLASGRFASAEDVLRAYALRYFDAKSPKAAAAWAAWLRPWGRPFVRDARAAAEEFTRLAASAPPSWRLAQWDAKTTLMAHHAAVGSGDEWTADRLQAADAFWAERERLDRTIHGLGPPRHIFHPERTPVPWYRSWARHVGRETQAADKLQAEQ